MLVDGYLRIIQAWTICFNSVLTIHTISLNEKWETRNRVTKAKSLLIYNKNQKSTRQKSIVLKSIGLCLRQTLVQNWAQSLCSCFTKGKALNQSLCLMIYTVGIIIFCVDLIDYSEKSVRNSHEGLSRVCGIHAHSKLYVMHNFVNLYNSAIYN